MRFLTLAVLIVFVYHFLRGFLRLPAWFNAIATACLWVLPAFFSVLMFWEITCLDDPFFNGMVDSLATQ